MKVLKIISMILITIIILLIGTSIFLKNYFTSEKIKHLILPYAENAIGRKLSVKDINISIFTGIEVSDITIQDNPDFRSAPFIKAEEVILKYALWPLLKKKLMIHKLILVKPHIFIERNEKGEFNFHDLIPRSETESTAPAPSSKLSSSASQAFMLTISQIDIRDGHITFKDKTPPVPSSLFLEKIRLTANDISLTAPFEIILSASLRRGKNNNPASLNLSGNIDLAPLNTDLKLSIDNMDIPTFSPYYSHLIPFNLLSSRLKLQAVIKTAGREKILTEGNVHLSQISFIHPALFPNEPIKNLDMTMNYAIDADLSQEVLSIEHFDVTALQIPLQISGQITHFTSENRSLSLQASLPEIDLQKTQNSIPPVLLPAIMKKIRACGKLSDVKVKVQGSFGQSSTLTYSGKGHLNDIQIIYKPFSSLVPNINGIIEIDSKNIRIPHIDIALLDSKTSLTGSLSDYLHKPFLQAKVESVIPNLARIYQAIPSDESPLLQKLKVQGATEIITTLAGDPTRLSALDYNGETHFHHIIVQYSPFNSFSPSIEGTVKFDKKQIITENLQIFASKSDMAVKAKVTDYRKVPSIFLDASSKILHLDEILDSLRSQASSSSASKSTSEPATTEKTIQREIGPYDFKGLFASGSIYIDKMYYKKLVFNEFKTAYSLKDNIFRWQNLKAETNHDGSVAMEGRLNFSQMSYSSHIDIQAIPLQEYLFAFVPKYAPLFSGTFSADIENVAGQGLSKEKILNNLYLRGMFTLVDGKMKGTELGKGIAELLRIANLSELEFNNLKGQIEIQKGKIHLDSELINEDYVLGSKGTIGFDGSLRLNLPIKISPRISKKNKLLNQYLTDEKGWTTVPIKANGNITKPVLKIDFKAIQEDTEEKLKEKLKEKLMEKLFKKSKDRDEEVPKSNKDSLKDTLKTFFK